MIAQKASRILHVALLSFQCKAMKVLFKCSKRGKPRGLIKWAKVFMATLGWPLPGLNESTWDTLFRICPCYTTPIRNMELGRIVLPILISGTHVQGKGAG
ncbi:hypothetical protein F5Y04DRAFT_254420 [Hypomontagnella monticulosa]|nr:hypothetical protein F5Y04DRAFT_254420 [Hypomontagnella monticulosa]